MQRKPRSAHQKTDSWMRISVVEQRRRCVHCLCVLVEPAPTSIQPYAVGWQAATSAVPADLDWLARVLETVQHTLSAASEDLPASDIHLPRLRISTRRRAGCRFQNLRIASCPPDQACKHARSSGRAALLSHSFRYTSPLAQHLFISSFALPSSRE